MDVPKEQKVNMTIVERVSQIIVLAEGGIRQIKADILSKKAITRIHYWQRPYRCVLECKRTFSTFPETKKLDVDGKNEWPCKFKIKGIIP